MLKWLHSVHNLSCVTKLAIYQNEVWLTRIYIYIVKYEWYNVYLIRFVTFSDSQLRSYCKLHFFLSKDNARSRHSNLCYQLKNIRINHGLQCSGEFYPSVCLGRSRGLPSDTPQTADTRHRCTVYYDAVAPFIMTKVVLMVSSIEIMISLNN